MSTSRWAESQVRTLFESGTLCGLSGRELLERFARHGDQAAFEAIVARHGPMVLGVCRRVLADSADVDDAFQATFLVLVRRAGTLGRDDVVAAWLHGVATKVARRARMDRARRRARERGGLAVEPGREPESPDFALREVVDEEIGRLPWKYRAPVVLCYLEGLTHEEAAARLGWPIGSVKGRLARARASLASRLGRRGVTAGAAALATERLGSAAVPEALAAAVSLAARRVAQGVAWNVVLSDPVSRLTKGASESMTATQLTAAALAAVALATAAGVGIAAARSEGPAPRGGAPPTVSASDDAAASPSASTSRADGLPGSSRDQDPRSAGILAKLDEPLSMNFPSETPLEDVLKYVKQATQTPADNGIPIYVDPIGLKEADKTTTSPVSIDLDGVPLRRTLQILLKQIDLVYYVEDGILVITSEGAAEAGLGPDMARPSPLQVDFERATRGEMTLEEMESLAQRIKLIGEIRKAMDGPSEPAAGGGAGGVQ
ncbi:RNA polymerase sigma factor [Paludisphaera soli]|uniref:RNA polymerase sigma factor n=1 Tax=Paludisphaera soli TaxID=2712865 RepID=UPI0013ED916D|nr:RNA polymerase sigma factor [Paludisphaera soli]